MLSVVKSLVVSSAVNSSSELWLDTRELMNNTSYEVRVNMAGWVPAEASIALSAAHAGSVVTRLFEDKAYFSLSDAGALSLEAFAHHGDLGAGILNISVKLVPKGASVRGSVDGVPAEFYITLDPLTPLPRRIVPVLPLGLLSVVLGLVLSRGILFFVDCN